MNGWFHGVPERVPGGARGAKLCPRGSGPSLETAGLVKLAGGSGVGAEGFCVPLLRLPGEFWRERYRAGMLTGSGSLQRAVPTAWTSLPVPDVSFWDEPAGISTAASS